MKRELKRFEIKFWNHGVIRTAEIFAHSEEQALEIIGIQKINVIEIK